MKIYIAAKLDRKKEVKAIIKKFEKSGHKIVVDWTEDAKLKKPYEDKKDIIRKRIERDVIGIKESDLFILLASAGKNRGMYVELGVALGLNMVKNKPKIYVVGNYKLYSSFFYHGKINRRENIEQVIKEPKTL